MAKENACASIESLEDCLKDKSVDKLITASMKEMRPTILAFKPVIDGIDGFLPGTL